MKPICLSLLVLTKILLGARGEPFRTDINPALLYFQSFLVAPDPMSDADRDYLDSKKGKEQKLPERFGKIVAGYDNQFRLELQKAHPGDDTKVMAGYRSSGLVTIMDFVGYINFWPRLVAASGGSSVGVLKLLREMEPLWPRLAQIMALPQPEFETRAKQFLADIQKSPNPFVILFNSYFTGFVLGGQNLRVRPKEFRVQAELAMVHAALEYKLHGESGWKSVMDPFGNGLFAFRRFLFKGVDRGFELKSAYAGADAPFVMIFVEKQGPPFQVIGPEAGKAIDK